MNTAQNRQSECDFGMVSFVKGITGDDTVLADNRPHIVFAGRSNAGKSSVINTVVGRKVARVSKTPGKTSEINLYDLDGQAYLTDLPGYGYARMSGKRAEKIRKQMIWYLGRSQANIAHLVLVVDIRRGLQEIDHELLDIAAGEEYPVTVVANKADKCNQSELVENQRHLDKQLKTREDIAPNVLTFSAHDKTGKEHLCAIIQSVYAD